MALGRLSPARTPAANPTAPSSSGAAMGRTLQAPGHHGGHSPGRRGSRGERGGSGCCLSAWLPAQCSPASDCPFCLPAGQARPHKTKRPVSAACGRAWRPARGTLRGRAAGWHPPRRACWGSAGSWGALLRAGHCPEGGAGVCGGSSPRWLLRDGDTGGIGVTAGITVTRSRGAAPPRPGVPADSTSTSQRI